MNILASLTENALPMAVAALTPVAALIALTYVMSWGNEQEIKEEREKLHRSWDRPEKPDGRE